MQKSNIRNRHIAHLGAILYNYSLFGFILTLTSVFVLLFGGLFLALFAIGIIFYYIGLFIIALFSVFLLLLSENFRNLFTINLFDKLSDVGNIFNQIAPVLLSALPYLAISTAVLGIISLILLLFDKKWEKAKSRISSIITFIIILIILVVLIFAGIITAGVS